MISTFKRPLVLWLCLLLSATLMAQIRGNEITVQVRPNHIDWNYQLGEEAFFTVAVLKNGCPLPKAKVDIEADECGAERRHCHMESQDEHRRFLSFESAGTRW